MALTLFFAFPLLQSSQFPHTSDSHLSLHEVLQAHNKIQRLLFLLRPLLLKSNTILLQALHK